MNSKSNRPGFSPLFAIIALVLIIAAFSLMSDAIGLDASWLDAKGEAMKDTLPAMIRGN